MSKKISISGYYGFDNFGDEGILGILIQALKSKECDKDVNNEITVFSSKPEKTSKRYDVKSINTFDYIKVLNNLENADVLISGGGSLLQDSTSIKSLLYYLWVIFMALVNKKKVIIFAQGIGPINNPFARFLTKILLRKTNHISVRDEKSLFLLRGWGLSPQLVADPMWNLELNSREPLGRIGIQLRTWKTLTDEFILSLARNVATQYSDKEIYIYSFQDSQDFDVCKKFQNYLSLINNDIKSTLIYQRTNKEMVDSFRNLDSLIAMRYHACLLAIKYGIPTLPISYDEKVEKLAKELDLEYLNLDEIEKIPTIVENLKSIDMTKTEDKVKSMRFDFTPVFDVINKD